MKTKKTVANPFKPLETYMPTPEKLKLTEQELISVAPEFKILR
jgi:hypothetical protein